MNRTGGGSLASRTAMHAGAAMLAAAMCASAMADPIDDIVGDYQLISSKTVPHSEWGFAKARLAIRRLDDQYVSIVLACGWKDSPKSACGERYFARRQGGEIYLQDVNTFGFRMVFDRASRRFTIISRGLDAARSVRHEVYAATTAPLSDPDLLRRMRKEQRYVDEDTTAPKLRRLDQWEFIGNRIAFQADR